MDSRLGNFSVLPEDLVHEIFSFADVSVAIGMSSVSSIWGRFWTELPYINFSTDERHSLPQFARYFRTVLSKRNDGRSLPSLNITFNGAVSQEFVTRIFRFAYPYVVKEVSFNWFPSICPIPNSLFRLECIIRLSLTGVKIRNTVSMFSGVPCLKKLWMKQCLMVGLVNGFDFTHACLSSLTLEDTQAQGSIVNLSAPMLETLVVRNWSGVRLIDTPKLVYLFYEDARYPIDICENVFNALEQVNLCICLPHVEFVENLVRLILSLKNVKYLELNLEILECLCLASSVEHVILHQVPLFSELKGLKVYPKCLNSKEDHETCLYIEIYFEHTYPKLTTTVTREYLRALNCVHSLQKLIDELEIIVAKNVLKAREYVHIPKDFGDKLAYIEGFWSNLRVETDTGYELTKQIIIKLKKIEDMFSNVQLPKMDTRLSYVKNKKIKDMELHFQTLEAKFATLCEQSRILMDTRIDRVRMVCGYNGEKRA